VSNLTRILATLLFATMTVGPVSAATVLHASQVAQGAATGSVSGTAKTAEGAPIPGALVTLAGPQTYTTTTDANGAFTISNVVPGVYQITVAHPGYQMAVNTIAVVAGAPQQLAVVMPASTFTSLRTIAHVSTVGRGSFNTTPASVQTLSSVDFQNEGQYTLNHMLDQIPGLQISYPTSSADAASPGAIVVPNIRGGLSYETASLIDGHPVAVVDYGDYVTTFLNSFMFSSVEVIKGPGAMSPQTNYAIGGTVNFHTKDPTLTFTPEYTFGYINDGGTYYNLGLSDTVFNGKLGFVVDIAGVNDPGIIHNQQTYFNPHSPSAVIGWNGTTGNVAAFNDSVANFSGTVSNGFLIQGLAACCYSYNGYFNQYAELFKLQYHFSDSTRLTVSDLVTETYADQDANTASTLLPAVFDPASGHGYAGSITPGTRFWETSGGPYPGPVGGAANEVNDEPIMQAEITTTLGDNTIVARYYHADVNRLINEGTDSPFDPIVMGYSYFGVNHEASNYTTYNGAVEQTAFFDYYRQFELDRLEGYSAEFTHPYGNGDEATLSWEGTTYQTNGVGSLAGCAPGANSAGQFTGFSYAASVTGGCPKGNVTYPGLAAPSTTVPGGASQIWNTYLLRNVLNVTHDLSWTVALYDNTYRNTYPYECVYTPGWYGQTASNLGESGAACSPYGTNVVWTTNDQSHFDERTALEWRPAPNLAVRFSAGSAIAPEYLAELSRPLGYPGTSTSPTVTINYPNPNLKPETSWGYDLGADYRFADGITVASVDGYWTNLYNHFITALNDSGIACVGGTFPGFPGSSCTTGAELYYSQNENVSNARFEGIELELRHIPAQGFGFSLSASTEHAYPYNISPNFYCTFVPTAAHPCVPANYNTNLNIVAGANFNGNGYQGSGVSVNGFSNTNIPYLTGNAELNWRAPGGWSAVFGSTFLGKNNSFNAPPFWITYASFRAPINDALSVQVSADNLFNSLPGYFEYIGTGPNYVLANGQQAVSIEDQLGPAVYHFELTKTFDGP
jgi:outer membrane receptor protein involved in Fe transport